MAPSSSGVLRTVTMVVQFLMLLWSIAIIVLTHLAIPLALRHAPFFDAIPIAIIVGATVSNLAAVSGLLALVRRTANPCTVVFMLLSVLELLYAFGIGVAFVISNHQLIDYTDQWRRSSEEAKCFYSITYECSGWTQPCTNMTNRTTSTPDCPLCDAFGVVDPPSFSTSCGLQVQRSLNLTELPTILTLTLMMSIIVALMALSDALYVRGGSDLGTDVVHRPTPPSMQIVTPSHVHAKLTPQQNGVRQTSRIAPHRGYSSTTAPPLLSPRGKGVNNSGTTAPAAVATTGPSPRTSRTNAAVVSPNTGGGGGGAEMDMSGSDVVGPPAALIEFGIHRDVHGRIANGL